MHSIWKGKTFGLMACENEITSGRQVFHLVAGSLEQKRTSPLINSSCELRV